MIAGTYFDGKTSRAHRANLTAAGGRAEIRLADNNEVMYSGRLDGLRISSRLANTQRSIRFDSNQLFMTQDNRAIDDLLRQHGSQRGLVHRLEARLLVAVGAAVGTLLIAAFTFVYAIPFLAGAIADRAPQRSVNAMGARWTNILDAIILDESELSQEERERVIRLSTPFLAEHRDLGAHLHFRTGIGPNALALLNGSIILTDELITMASNEELIAVLLHELGHLKHRHLLKQVLQQSTIALIVVVATGDVGTASELLGATTILASLAYSRDFEREADVYALEGLLNAGIDPSNLGSILDRLTSLRPRVRQAPDADHAIEPEDPDRDEAREHEELNGGDSTTESPEEITIIRKDDADAPNWDTRERRILNYLSTHPSTPERVELAREYQRRWEEMQETLTED